MLKTFLTNETIFQNQTRKQDEKPFRATPNILTTEDELLTAIFPEPRIEPIVQTPMPSFQDMYFLPPVSIPKYNGSPRKWVEFWGLYESMIHKRNIDKCIKLYHLRSHLEGEAAQSIANLGNSAEDYDLAIQTLHNLFGDPKRVAHKIRADLIQYSITEHSTTALYKDWSKLNQLYSQLVKIGDVADTALVGQLLEAKFPRFVLQRVYGRNGGQPLNGERMLYEIGEVLRQEANLDRILADNKSNTFKKATKEVPALKIYSSTDSNKETEPVLTSQDGKTAKLCDFCNQDHPNFKCLTYHESENKLELIRANQLCLNCLKKGHRAKECPSKRTCKHCEKKHHTSLCFKNNSNSKEQKKVRFEENDPVDSDDKSAPERENTLAIISDEEPKEEQVFLAQTEQKSVQKTSILMTTTVRVKHGTQKQPLLATVFLDHGSTRNYITQELADELKLKPILQREVRINTFGNNDMDPTVTNVYNLKIHDTKSKTFEVETIAMPKLTCQMWAIDKSEALLDRPRAKQVTPNILLGIEHASAIMETSRTTTLPSGFKWADTKIGTIIYGEGIARTNHKYDFETFHAYHQVEPIDLIDIKVLKTQANSPDKPTKTKDSTKPNLKVTNQVTSTTQKPICKAGGSPDGENENCLPSLKEKALLHHSKIQEDIEKIEEAKSPRKSIEIRAKNRLIGLASMFFLVTFSIVQADETNQHTKRCTSEDCSPWNWNCCSSIQKTGTIIWGVILLSALPTLLCCFRIFSWILRPIMRLWRKTCRIFVKPENNYQQGRTRNRRDLLSKLLATTAILIMIISTIQGCSEVTHVTSDNNHCRIDEESDIMTCQLQKAIQLALQPVGQTACVHIRVNNDTTQSIRVTTTAIKYSCHYKSWYYTRDFDTQVESVHRCRQAAGSSCFNNQCEDIKPTDEVAEFSQAVRKAPGHSHCTRSCQCVTCNGCFLCEPSCLFWRLYAQPKTQIIYQIGNCPTWELKATIKLEIGNQTLEMELQPSKPYKESNATITLLAVTTPQLPLMTGTFINKIDSDEAATVSASQPSQPSAGTIGAFQCPTQDDAQNFNCHFPEMICACTPSDFQTSCNCNYQNPVDFITAKDSKLPLKSGPVEISYENKQYTAMLTQQSGLLLQMDLDAVELGVIAYMARCKIDLIGKLTGCHSCNQGADVQFTCQSKRTTTVDITCDKNNIYSLPCDNKTRTLNIITTRPHYDVLCNYTCPKTKRQFRLEADLEAVAIQQGKDRSIGGSWWKPAAEVPIDKIVNDIFNFVVSAISTLFKILFQNPILLILAIVCLIILYCMIASYCKKRPAIFRFPFSPLPFPVPSSSARNVAKGAKSRKNL